MSGESAETSTGAGPQSGSGPRARPLIFIVAGEHSGDALGAKLMAALRARLGGDVGYLGVGGHLMEEAGLQSQFPLADIAVMGLVPILRRLPLLVRRVYQTVDAVIAADPDMLIIIDAPEFTHAVAKRVRRKRPSIPIVDYVSPTVWAWRPGRAKAMAPYVDHLLALLPFEPAAHAALGGPPTTYVGHPLLEKLPWIEALDPAPFAARAGIDRGRPLLVVLPGSRRSEVERLMDVFGQAVGLLAQRQPGLQVVLPVMPSVAVLVDAKLKGWPSTVAPIIVAGTDEALKYSAFKLARAALAASGTVTLELALTRTPTVVAYKVDVVISALRHLIKTKTSVLPNLITGRRAVPEFHQEACTASALAGALQDAMADGEARAAQLAEFADVATGLALRAGTASEAAADVVMTELARGRR